jgi:hypothetical protein
MYQQRAKRIAVLAMIAAAVVGSVAGATIEYGPATAAVVASAPGTTPPPPPDKCSEPNVVLPPECGPISSTEYAQNPPPIQSA